jgi:hypothetical protein
MGSSARCHPEDLDHSTGGVNNVADPPIAESSAISAVHAGKSPDAVVGRERVTA